MTGPPPELKTPSPDVELGGGLREGVEESTLEGRVQRYAKGKRRALDIVAHLREYGGGVASTGRALPRTLEPLQVSHQIERCGSYLVFRDYYTLGRTRLHKAEFCKRHLLCPFCAMRRGAKFVKAYSDKLQALLIQNPDLKPYLVTFTVKNGPELLERFRHLESAMKTLTSRRRRSLAGNSRNVSPFDDVEAAVWTVEFTNKGNGWHPHIHAFVLAETPPSQTALRATWERITLDSFIVDVTPVDTSDGFIGAFCEVFKYALKFSELTEAQTVEAFYTLRGKRLVSSLGAFRGLEPKEWLTDDPDEELDLAPYVERMYRYYAGRYQETPYERSTPHSED